MGDFTSGDLKDDAAANMDFGGGGGGGYEEAAYGGSKSDFYSTPQPSGGGGGYEEAAYGGSKSDFYSTSVPTVSPPMSPFQLGFGGAQKVPNYMDDLNTLMGGGGSSADASDVSVSDSGPDTTTTNYMAEAFEKKPPSVPDTTTENYMTEAYGSPGAMSFAADPPATPSFVAQQPQVSGEAVQQQFDALTSLRQPKTDQDFSFLGYVGNIFKGLGSGAKTLGDFISNLSASDAFKLFNDFLIGDKNYKGPSPAQQDLFNVPGPGPAVGGGMPSPSGGGDAGGAPQTPAETVMGKDPCPPGFKLDPILNQCMPIVKSAPTPPPMPTLPQPTAPTGGGIANVYPFTLTPPAGSPIGTVAPIQFTPK